VPSSWVPDVRIVRRCLLGSRIALPAVAVAVAALVVVGYRHADDLSDDAASWFTLGPAALFGLVVGVHVVHRHRGRRLGLVRGRTWLDIVVVALAMAAIGLVVSAIDYDAGDDGSDFLFDAGMSLWIMSWLAAGIGWLLVLSFVDAPLQLARTMGKRAGWYLLVVMAAVYLLATSLALYDDLDDPPALLSLPGAIIYAAVTAIGVVLIVEQTKAHETASTRAGKNKRDHHQTGRGHLDR
jgi:hypothetical protein